MQVKHHSVQNSMVSYINDGKNSREIKSSLANFKGNEMSNSCESLVGRNQAANEKESQNCYFNSCCCFMMFICLIVGFIVGGIVGIYLEKNGNFDIFRYAFKRPKFEKDEERPSEIKCVIKSDIVTERPRDCGICSMSRILNVSNAEYADCNGLYTISNLSSVWDSKRIVYERIAGGLRSHEKRFIYWNSHYYGENFYGWSIGDAVSLVESGPFHSQVRGGVSNHPLDGSWSSNISVKISSCFDNGFKNK